ncbi:MAG: DMT family transporter [Candidatus Zixiibacteriota bacterium]
MTYLVYVLICLIWGSTWIAIKIGLSQAPPFYTSSLRFLLSLGILVAIVAIKKYPYPKGFKNFFSLGVPGFFMYGISYALVYFSEIYIDSSLAALLFGSFPFFVALLSMWQLKSEKLQPLGWLGLIIGMAGVTLISYDSLQTSRDLFLGTLLLLGGAGASACGMVLHKKKFSNRNIFVCITVQMMFGGFLLVLGALLFEDISDFVVSPESVGSILYLAVLGSVVTFLGYYWLLARTRAVTVSMIAFITPLVAIFIGVVFFEESLSLRIAYGAVLILSGILLVERPRKNRLARQRTSLPN